MDLQNAFLLDEFPTTFVAEALGVVPNVNRPGRGRARRRRDRLVGSPHGDHRGHGRSWSNLVGFLGLDEEGDLARTASLREGAFGHGIHDALARCGGDETVLKTRFSAFVQGSSDIHERLQAAGVNTLIVVGTVTNVCCESTLRDAMMR